MSDEQAPPSERGENARTRRWERMTYWPLTVAALVFLIVYTVHVIGDVHGLAAVVTRTVITIIWVMFIVDYLVRLLLASPPRRRWALHHLFDLAVVLVPALRPVRLLGVLTHVRAFTRTAASSLRTRLLIYGIGAAMLLIWDISLSVLQAERHAPGASITSFGDAVWWAFCTVTTVGYGDYVPVTAQGRVLAVLLMVGGVVLVGMIVATFSSWVLERATRGHTDQLPATRADVERLLQMLNETPRRSDPPSE
ncbi:MAG: ion channel [Microbacterium sp.]|uniref:potassium channel family protein n=1 Tax=Microbacterium sp. TaxID=51671 RepID=UPI0039E260B8